MKILVDTNIILDVVLNRQFHYENSAKVWSLVSEKKMTGCISAISINNLHYILLKQKDIDSVGELIDQLLDEFNVIPLTRRIIQEARKIDKRDLEDMIQFISARKSGCDYIVTRNVKDFPKKEIIPIEPVDFLKTIKGTSA
jgi:predicted nucleic acid-binding protein